MTRCWAVLLLILASAPFAQTCPTHAQKSDVARLDFLSRELSAESNRLYNWTFAWGASYGVLTLGQLAVVPAIVPSDQIEWYVAAATTAGGVALVVMDPNEVLASGPDFAKRAASGTDVCALIAEGEALLERGASHEVRATRWYMHAVNVVFNLGVGLFLGLAYDHWVAGAVNVLLGVAMGEATILTSPMRLVSAWAEYQRGELGEQSPISLGLFPLLLKDGGGLGVALSF